MKRLTPRGLHERVIEEIGKAIVSGEFRPGTTLPPEEQLCGMLGVSRTALREALRVLASKGLVEPKRKIGTLVQESDRWNFLDADILSWLVEVGDTDQVLGELYELRHLLEPMAASLAAQHARAQDIKALQKAYGAMQAAGEDGERFAEPDLKFHQAIIAASGNRLFSSLAQVVGAALAVNFRLVRDVPQGHTQSMPLHRRVLQAIQDHDVPGARLAMQTLIERSQRDARNSVQRRAAKHRLQSGT